LWGSLSLWFLVSDHASCTNFLRHINSFLLVLLDAFSSRFFNTSVLFLFTLYSSFFFWCLVQSGLFLFLKLAFLCYSSTALAGGYSCVTLTLTLSVIDRIYIKLSVGLLGGVLRLGYPVPRSWAAVSASQSTRQIAPPITGYASRNHGKVSNR